MANVTPLCKTKYKHISHFHSFKHLESCKNDGLLVYMASISTQPVKFE